MDDKLLLWKDATLYLFGELSDIIVASDDLTQLTLKTNKQTVTICWKEKGAKETWFSLYNETKKKEKK